MVKAYNPNSRFPYVLEVDRVLPAEQQTVFVFRPLSLQDDLELEEETEALFVEKVVDGVKVRELPRRHIREYARHVLSRALVTWTPIPNDVEGGEPIKLERDAENLITQASFDALGRHTTELMLRARRGEELTPAQAGKS